jgi:hypothetical protein
MHLKISAAIPEISTKNLANARLSNAPEYDESAATKDLVITAPVRKADISDAQNLPNIQVTDLTASGTRTLARINAPSKVSLGSSSVLSSAQSSVPKEAEAEIPRKMQSFASYQNLLSSSNLHQVLLKMPDFNWSVFELFDVTDGHCLPALSMHIFQKEGLFSSLQIPPEKFLNFVLSVERSYHNDLPCKYKRFF